MKSVIIYKAVCVIEPSVNVINLYSYSSVPRLRHRGRDDRRRSQRGRPHQGGLRRGGQGALQPRMQPRPHLQLVDVSRTSKHYIHYIF